MKKKTVKPPPEEDEAQSKRFLDLASELEAAGELNLTEAGEAFRRVVNKALPEVRKTRVKSDIEN